MKRTVVAEKIERHIHSRLWSRSDHISPCTALLPPHRKQIKYPPACSTLSTTTSSYSFLCLRMPIRKRSTANLKDDGASRRPTRRRTPFWNRGQKEIIRGRVPAYRLREDALRDYLGRIFPEQENFHVQVSWRQRCCQHAK
jgi:hypothetical protein